jgi:HTH-type transcriptional regulator/antitoxin HipB
MNTIYTVQQLGKVLRGRRKAKALTQKEAAKLVGLLPKTVSGLESSPDRCKIESLFKLLAALELELTISPKEKKYNSKIDW